MKALALFFPLTAVMVFIQALTGGYTVLNFYDFGAHMISGYVTGIFALIAVALAFVAKPKYNALRWSSLVLLVLVIIQGLIGFAAETSDQIVGIHFGNFLVIYGVSIATVFYAFRWSRMPTASPQSGGGKAQ